jgi:hypothetical protein
MAEETKAQDALPQPSAEEMAEAFSGSAVFANKIYLTLIGPNARLAFAELTQPDQKPVFRSAVIMTINDLFALQDAIGNLTPTRPYPSRYHPSG